MAVTRWDPFTVLAHLDRDFDELVRRTWGAPVGRRGSTAGYVPATDVATEGEDVVLTLELPGVDIERDVDIEVHDGRLTISGQRRESSEHEEGGEGSDKVLVREMRYGSFRREFALPEGVDADDVSATYDRGLLQVRVRSVAKPAPQPRKIAISAAQAPQAVTATSSPTSDGTSSATGSITAGENAQREN